jgi:CDP-diacylglycerol---glycerol-3-phosphate 3-phosphatidyltransferase
MKTIWESIIKGYLRLIEPVAALLVRLRINPNTLTTIGTLCTVSGGLAFATGHIMLAGWIIGLTAIFDVLDGIVARRSGRSTVFGAFYDSTLDRVADGAVLGGIAWFFATDATHRSLPIFGIALVGILGTFLVSYTRARAEGLGIDAKVGVMQRAERIVILSAPQAFFGLALGGWVLASVVVILAVTAWITAVQRMLYVRRRALIDVATPLPIITESKQPVSDTGVRRAQS